MISKELKIYKNPDKEFILDSYKQVTRNHRRLFLRGNESLEYDDVLWAKIDMDKKNQMNIVVVEHVYDDGSVRVRVSDQNTMKKLRKFDSGESFFLIASFKEVKDGDTKTNLS